MLFFAILAACDGGEPLACDASAAYSTTVNVVDADGADIPDVVVTYAVDDVEFGACDTFGGTWSCGVEVAGHFAITASAPGFTDQTVEVDVAQGECHVLAAQVALTLEAADCTAEEVAGIAVTLTGSGGETLDTPIVQYRDAMIDDTPWVECSGTGETWTCADELTGTFDVRGTASGHTEVFDLVIVELDEAGCHPVTESVTLVVEWLPD